MGYRIETATVADIPELLELRLGYLTADVGKLSKEQRKELEFEVPNYLRYHLGRTLHVFVAREDETNVIASCAWLLLVEKPPSPRFPHGHTGVLFNVFTLPEHRRQGLARRVMNRLIDDARARALDVLELHATDDGYPLYRLLGFEDDRYTHVPMRLML
ncbi:MAG: GNAT family N-acetyltransferase [Coriobacteriales bacterium]|jgi:GNAT superfamily N-acetyltransferase|nr:GNAT family N-acetyltransferase [Coriobacteriales bacterium]MDO5708708.1 GNAT family N-acetyltransferase [Coriobacteriales bacterium]